MGLEAGTYIADLVETNPDGAVDPKSQGDDHLRLLKATIKNTFPGMGGRIWRFQSKASPYTVVMGDNNTIIDATAALTLNWTACATLGNGHAVWVYARGGDVTIDPAGAELINGAATLLVPTGFFSRVLCTGTELLAESTPATGGAFIPLTQKGAANGVATLGANGKIPEAQLPDTVNGKNIITNGDFNIWQRQIAFSGITAAYTADRWFVTGGTGGSLSVVAAATGPTPVESTVWLQNVLRIAPQVADPTPLAAGDIYYFEQRIEGYNWQQCAGRAMVLSFWARSSIAGTFCVALQNAGGDRGIVFEYTLPGGSIWTRVSIPITASPSAGTWFYDYRIGIRVAFTLAAGTSYHTATPGVWMNASPYATVNQLNLMNSTANTMEFTGIQLEAGTVATLFEKLPVALQMERCQRYYEKSYNKDVYPGAISTLGIEQYRALYSGGDIYTIHFKTRKRFTPTTGTIFSALTGTGGVFADASAGVDRAGAQQTLGETTMSYLFGTSVANNGMMGQWTVDAEL